MEILNEHRESEVAIVSIDQTRTQEITSEHREGEVTVFTNNATPEVHLTTRREEAKATVNENSRPIIVVAENIETVKEVAERADLLDDVITSLPQIMQAANAAEIAEQAKLEAISAKNEALESKETAVASAETALSSSSIALESANKAQESASLADQSAKSALTSKESASASAKSASESMTQAKQSAQSASASASVASEKETLVKEYATRAETASADAENAKTIVVNSINKAETAERNAAASAQAAKNSENIALQSENKALASATTATQEANRATEQASLASSYSSQALQASNTATQQATIATEQASNASQSATVATEQANLAKEYAEQAQSVDLSDYITKTEANDTFATNNELSDGLSAKQDTLSAGEGIKIEGNVISATAQVPDNVYTEENLLAGGNVTFTKVTGGGGIDEHTLACWHFDGSPYDEVSGLGIRGDTTGSYTTGVFGNAIYSLYSNKVYSALVLTDQKIENGFTVDCFVLPRTSITTSSIFSIYAGGNNNLYGISATLNLKTGEVALAHRSANLATYTVAPFGLEDKPHLALQLRGTVAEVYVEGKRVIQHDVSSILSALTGTGFLINCSNANFAMDELRISDVARYNGDFTPPTEPYKRDDAGPIGTTIDVQVPTKVSELENDSGFITAEDLPESGGASFPLFYHTFADHILNDASWLRADTFSWQSGDMYVSAYNHLVADLEGITAEAETIGSTEITYYRANDGHKIVLADQESKVSDIYRATGVAWYYILDTENKRFKLPRTKHNFAGIRTGVGNFVEAGLPNITGSVTDTYQMGNYGTVPVSEGALYSSQSSKGGTSQQSGNSIDIHMDASRSNSIYGNSDTVQPPSTEQYLYFYVGNTVRNQTEVDVGAVTEQLNGKVDKDNLESHLPDNMDYVVEFYNENKLWYKKYKSGWIEQGGLFEGTFAGTYEYSLILPFQNTDYTIMGTGMYSTNSSAAWVALTKTETTFKGEAFRGGSGNVSLTKLYWYACGQGAF